MFRNKKLLAILVLVLIIILIIIFTVLNQKPKQSGVVPLTDQQKAEIIAKLKALYPNETLPTTRERTAILKKVSSASAKSDSLTDTQKAEILKNR